MRCLVNDHSIETCSSNKIKCINCGKAHSCNFKACWSIVNETKKNHQFMFSIILGEKVKSNPYEVLNLSEYFTESGLVEVDGQNGCDPEFISDLVQQHALVFHERFEDHETRIVTNTKQVTIALDRIQKQDDILELHQKILNEHSECINKLTTTSVEIGKITSELWQQNSSLKTDISTLKSSNEGIVDILKELKNSVMTVINK